MLRRALLSALLVALAVATPVLAEFGWLRWGLTAELSKCSRSRLYGVVAQAGSTCSSVTAGTDIVLPCQCNAAGTGFVAIAGGGAEVNDLEATDPPTIADTEIYVGNGAGSGAFVTVSADGSLANSGALTISATHSGSAHHAESHAVTEADHTTSGGTAKHVLQQTGASTFGWDSVRLLSHATDCTGLSGGLEGEACWEIDDNTLYVCEPSAGDCDTAGEWNAATAAGDGVGYDTIEDEGASLTKRAVLNFVGAGVSCVDDAGNSETDCTISGGGGGATDKLYTWTAAALSAVGEPGDNFAPTAQDSGTNVDVVVALFDDTTDECRGAQFHAPPDLDTAGTVTFRASWYSGTATTGDAILDFRHSSGIGESSAWDASLTTEAAAADTTQGTVDQVTVTTWTETVTNLGWTAGELVTGLLCRDANAAGDTLAGDLLLLQFSVEVPRS